MAEQFLEGEMSKTAIVVVDMLYDFIDGSLACCHAQEAVKAAKSAIERSVVDEPDYPVLLFSIIIRQIIHLLRNLVVFGLLIV